MNKIAALAAGLCLLAGSAAAQTSPNLTFGQVLTPAQWNQLFINKQDTLGFVPLNTSGGVMLGRLVTAPPSSTTSGFNLTPGTTPGSPANGDLWVTSVGIFAQVNGATVGPLAGAVSASFAATSPIKVTFPASVVTYAFDFTVQNTFLAAQTTQGATTTQPGWFVQLPTDTTSRIHLGLTTLDVPTLSFGSGSATRDAFIQRVGAGSFRYGGPDAASAVAQTLSVQNVLAGTSNAAGAATTFAGSRGTGTGAGGGFVFQTAPAGSSGTAQNALATTLSIAPNALTLNGLAIINTAAANTTGLTVEVGGNSSFIIGTDASANVLLRSQNSVDLRLGVNATTWLTITSAGLITHGGATALNGATTITSASASALAVGLNGATNPAFVVNASTASQAAGLSVSGAATGGTVAIATIDSGANNNLTVDAKGTGTIQIGSISTGAITLARATTISGALTAAAASFSGTVNHTGAFQINSNAMTFPAAAATLTQTVASGSTALGTSAIGSGACATVVTATATGALTTDAPVVSFNGDPTSTVGFQPLTSGALTIFYYPTANTMNFKECNLTAASITPGATTINWRIPR